MNELDQMREEVTAILNQKELSAGDIRRLGYLEAQISNWLARYDY